MIDHAIQPKPVIPEVAETQKSDVPIKVKEILTIAEAVKKVVGPDHFELVFQGIVDKLYPSA